MHGKHIINNGNDSIKQPINIKTNTIIIRKIIKKIGDKIIQMITFKIPTNIIYIFCRIDKLMNLLLPSNNWYVT